MSHLIAPSLLSADFLNLERDVRMLNDSEADWIHFDIMDGNFVPNISFGMPVLKAVNKIAGIPLDVHLMIKNPDQYIGVFRDCGANILTVHAEEVVHLDRTLNKIRETGMKAGVSINPSTTPEVLREIMYCTDLILVMSVNPGFGGQKFIENTYEKLRRIGQLKEETGTNPLIEIDGGVNVNNAAKLIGAGADVLVAGNAVFGSGNPTETISALKNVKPGVKSV